jgi:Uma2 family endonuclease
MATVPRLLTYEEWIQMPPVQDGTDEVVKGELRCMPPTRYPHADIIRRLISVISKQVNEKEVLVYGSNLGLLIRREPLTCRSPDLTVYHRDGLRIEDGLFHSAPDLIVEVLSPSENRRRKEEKLEDYATLGVPEVWLVSPQAESIEVRLLNAGRYERTAILVEGALQPTRFAGVSIAIPAIWPETE